MGVIFIGPIITNKFYHAQSMKIVLLFIFIFIIKINTEKCDSNKIHDFFECFSAGCDNLANCTGKHDCIVNEDVFPRSCMTIHGYPK